MYSSGVSEEKNRRRPARSRSTRNRPGAERIGAMRVLPTGGRSRRSRGHRPAFGPSAALPIMAIFLLLAGLGSALLTVRLHNQSVDAGSVSPFAPATRAVVFVLDGVDPAALHVVSMPNLAALQQNGVAYTGAWVGQMETTASASAATIGTGAFPRVDRLVGDIWYDSKSKTVVRPTLPQNVLVGSIDTVMEPSGVDSVASELKTRRPAARILSVGGTNCAAAAAAATWTADYVVCAQRERGRWSPVSIAGHELPASATAARAVQTKSTGRGRLATEMQGWNPGAQDDWIARETVQAMRVIRPALQFVNFPEVAIMRQRVPAARAAGVERTIMRGLDADIGRVVQEARREGTFKSTIFVLTSGRAFEPVDTRMSYRRLSSAIVAAGGQATYLAGDASALIGLRDPLQAQPVAQALQSENSASVDAVYFKSQSGSAWSYAAQYLNPGMTPAFERACSYLLSTVASGSSPDVVVVYRPHAGLVYAGKSGGATGSIGVPWPVQHVPLILSGHGVYAGRTSSYPARLVDIAPTLESALGLPATRHDGIVLQDALYGTAAASNTQSSERTKLAPLVSALRARAVTPAR
jgi:hypothetical protein